MNPPTQWTLYGSNEEAWAAILADCSRAKKSIVLEQFIFAADSFGQKLIDVCVERAAAGVKVRFLWDAAGSFTIFGSGLAEDLQSKGIELVFWRTLIPEYFKIPNFRSWFLRNHRRTLVVDEEVAYTGSISIRDSMRGWKDTNARFMGPVVAQMHNAFERMWARAKKDKRLPMRKTLRNPEFSYETNTPTPGKRRMYHVLVEAIRNARSHIYLTTPYFVPTRCRARCSLLAAQRGIDVLLIIPDKTDHYPSLDLGARSFFKPLLDSGVRIFLYPSHDGSSLMHGKTVVIDGSWATIGSLNLDNVSLLYNYEANIVSTNARFAEELEAHFIHDMNISKEVDPVAWKSRFFLERLPEYAIKAVRRFL